MTGGLLAGVNVGGTTTSVVLGTADGTILERQAWPTQADDGEALYAGVADALRALAVDARAIGVAIGGPMDARTGVVISAPHLPGMHGFQLGERLRADMQKPIAVHHDAAACALAEVRWGVDRGVAGLAYLTCGTGFGAGIVIDGRARYGSRGLSPELGHVRYRDEGPDVFGKPGCFESYGAASALPKLARMRDPSFSATSGAEVADRAAHGDAIARNALEDNAAAVGAACALLADLLVLDANPLDNIVLQGRFDTYPKRRGMTRVKELDAAGINVACGHDSIMDPWYPLGRGSMLDALSMLVHVGQMTGRHELFRAFDMVTVNPARAAGVPWGVKEGLPANFVVFDCADEAEAIRLRPAARWVVRAGRVVAETVPAASVVHQAGQTLPVTFTR